MNDTGNVWVKAITAEQRKYLIGHRGCVVWFTGLSGAGKTTLSTELEKGLFLEGKHTYLLDADTIRHGLCSDLDYSPEGRRENIRRIGEVASLFADAGLVCITAFISPYRADRDLARKISPPGRFIEVHLSTPLKICERRDVKGFYQMARKGLIRDFTGISAPYENPKQPEIKLRTDKLSVSECVQAIRKQILKII